MFSFVWAGEKHNDGDQVATVELQIRLFDLVKHTNQEGKEVSKMSRTNCSLGSNVDETTEQEILEFFSALNPDQDNDVLTATSDISGRPLVHGQIISYPNVPLEELRPMKLMFDLADRLITSFRMTGAADPQELNDFKDYDRDQEKLLVQSPPRSPELYGDDELEELPAQEVIIGTRSAEAWQEYRFGKTRENLPSDESRSP